MNIPPMTFGEARQAAQQRMQQQFPQPPRQFMLEEFPREQEEDENDIISASLLGTVSVPTALRNRHDLRSGKWTKEEEAFAFTVIQQFQAGTLNIPETATLRQCLSVALNCDAMRISKKFAGPYSIGKQVFTPLDKNVSSYAAMIAVSVDELNIARTSWFRKLDEIENQSISRSRKRMRLEEKGKAPFMFEQKNTVLRNKSEAGDLESFRTAVMELSSLKHNEVGTSLPVSTNLGSSITGEIVNQKVPKVIKSLEKILRGDFAQYAPPASAVQPVLTPFMPHQAYQLSQMQLQLQQMPPPQNYPQPHMGFVPSFPQGTQQD